MKSPEGFGQDPDLWFDADVTLCSGNQKVTPADIADLVEAESADTTELPVLE